MAYDTNNYRDDWDPRFGGMPFNSPNYGNYGWGGRGWEGYGGYGPTPYYNYYEASSIEMMDDDDIKEGIIDNLASDWMISRRDFGNINVEAHDGIATLTGEVRDRRTKHHAYSVAFWSPGVVDVINKLKVKNEQRQQRNRNQNYNPGYAR